ncbi:hypothetical protein V3N00_18225 [Acinetobacter baumannii]|uniref:hypothetical protein n=1 Tax=Acinetobacter TaxID=469 RepID=UPI000DE5D834|nr:MULTISPECIES: hypothetical protein [Acinetobacter]MDE3319620.1 hypothetical protein [Acinetobacter baumannii]MDX5549680.1 hypothetical protein [Acinetobacter baumannii]SSQ10007.1 Uncharacterised protein [Acinetobacter baumannii]HCT3680641.1 hypothetical protein [Acinetobacter baumannii]
MNAQVFKSEALSRLAVRLPSAVPVMAKVDIDQVVKVVKVESGEVYIISQDTKGKYENPFHVWFMHKSGFILRSANGVLGYKSAFMAEIHLNRTIRLKGQRTLKAN